ncbi:hypothetical protein [Sphingobacterium sp. JUb56]|uniref:hypothetical protein n=1 Tax=Sphingobacterium sp. JUb56 TaxID=2587145 RepID=UPI00160E46E0|nr:hypothetical protein [Sphingobacterium sp. JUb56]MBB2951606.1 hypothetical protein [Sphingobacterium sp. JUb56]
MKRYYIFIFSLMICINFKINATQKSKNLTLMIDSSDLKSNIIQPYNLFYLSKYLSHIRRSPQDMDKIYSSMLNLVGKDKLATITNDSTYKKIYEFKERVINIQAEQVLEDLKGIGNNNTNRDVKIKPIKISTKELSEFNLLYTEWKKLDDDLTAKKKQFQEKTENNKSIIEDLALMENATIVQIEEILKRHKINNYPLDSLKNPDVKEVKLLLNKIKTENTSEITSLGNEIDPKNTLSIKRDSLYKQLEDKTKALANNMLDNKDVPMSIKSFLVEQIGQNQQESLQINLTTTAQNAQQGLNYTGLSIPSQSQMIEAMAMFLAKRAKQEAVIWFMDQLRARVKNPLVFDVFPETIELLEGLTDYQTANFGTSWRYAISKDFVEMPRNISKSTWTKQFLSKEDATQLESAVDLGYDIDALIKARYNYRDIIRQLYLNPKYSADPDIYKKINDNKQVQNIIAVLYMITNELFTIDDKKSYRLLSYEELKTLDNEQWKVLLELFELKYGQVFKNLPDVKGVTKEKVIAWISPLLISLGQFDKINQEQQALLEKSKPEQINRSFSSTWTVLTQVISNFETLPTTSVNAIERNKYLESIKNIFKVIEDIQEKNFVAATQNTLKLVDSYYQSNGTNKVIQTKLVEAQNAIDKNLLKLHFFNNEITIQSGNSWNRISIEENQIEYIKYVNLTLQRIDKKDLSEYYKELKKENIGPFVTAIEKITPNKEEQLYLINLIALYYSLQKEEPNKEILTMIKTLSHKNPKLAESLSVTRLSEMSYANQLVKLSGFFGDVITSSTSAELSNVIESHALPPTSYKLKRKMSSSVDLNAYVGAFAGRILPIGNSSLGCKWTGGITAPIGVTVKLKGDFFKYFNLNVQVLDLGNLVNHYLITPDSAYNKEVHFSEVLSPGFNLLYNIKNTPIVAFIGGKLLPLKSYLPENSNKMINDKAFDAAIINVGLKIDIPLMNLYSGK